MSSRESRTVTGVVTSATCTLISFLGACCTGTPGLGGSGPVGACPSSGPAAASIARRSQLNRHPCRFIQRSEEHTSELQSQSNIVCRLLLEKKKHTDHLQKRIAGFQRD